MRQDALSLYRFRTYVAMFGTVLYDTVQLSWSVMPYYYITQRNQDDVTYLKCDR
jgi:hypothetical protein